MLKAMWTRGIILWPTKLCSHRHESIASRLSTDQHEPSDLSVHFGDKFGSINVVTVHTYRVVMLSKPGSSCILGCGSECIPNIKQSTMFGNTFKC